MDRVSPPGWKVSGLPAAAAEKLLSGKVPRTVKDPVGSLSSDLTLKSIAESEHHEAVHFQTDEGSQVRATFCEIAEQVPRKMVF